MQGHRIQNLLSLQNWSADSVQRLVLCSPQEQPTSQCETQGLGASCQGCAKDAEGTESWQCTSLPFKASPRWGQHILPVTWNVRVSTSKGHCVMHRSAIALPLRHTWSLLDMHVHTGSVGLCKTACSTAPLSISFVTSELSSWQSSNPSASQPHQADDFGASSMYSSGENTRKTTLLRNWFSLRGAAGKINPLERHSFNSTKQSAGNWQLQAVHLARHEGCSSPGVDRVLDGASRGIAPSLHRTTTTHRNGALDGLAGYLHLRWFVHHT